MQSTPNHQVLIHDSDSEDLSAIMEDGSIQPLHTVPPVLSQEQETEYFLQSEAGQRLIASLEATHSMRVAEAVAAASLPPPTPAAGAPEVLGPQAAAAPTPAQPARRVRVRQPVRTPSPVRIIHRELLTTAPAQSPTQPRVATPSKVDLREAVKLYGTSATLTMPRAGHTSRAGVIRSGNAHESSWSCRTCSKKVLAVRRSGQLLGVPVYICPESCDAMADPPALGEPSDKVKKQQKGRLSTPPYPWLLPLKEQSAPPPIVPGRPQTAARTPTAATFRDLGAQHNALTQLRQHVHEGRHTGLLETEATPSTSSASSATTTTRADQFQAETRSHLGPIFERLAATMSPEDLRALFATQP